jgi:hypothetical protein
MDNRNGNPLTHKSYYNYCYFYDETNLKVVRNFFMTKSDIEQIISTEYLKPTDWYNMVVGTIVGTCIYGPITVLIVMKLGASRPLNWVTLLLVLLFIIYSYWIDGKVKLIKTGLTKEENLKLLRSVFKKLNWPTKEYTNQIEIRDDKYILKFIHATVIYADDYIGYNFQYNGNFKSGRPAFSIGIRTYLRSKFQKELNKQLSVC